MEALNLVEETVDVDGLQLSILRPLQAEALLSEEAFEHEEFLPYWAELWPSGVALARVVAQARRSRGSACSSSAAGSACRASSPPWAAPGCSRPTGRPRRSRWPRPTPTGTAPTSRRRSSPGPARSRCSRARPWDLVLGADLLYERRNVDQLLDLLPRLGGEILLAEPGRPPAARFFEEVALEVEPLDDRVYRLTAPGP